jgi:hypothetical protein
VLRRIVLSLLLVVAVGMFWLAGRNGNADPEPTMSESAVEQLIPGDGSPSVLRQAEIGIDLKDGWVAELAINGVQIPADQLRTNGPLSQFFFTPGEGKEIEQFTSGSVIVVASIWRPIDGEAFEDARQVVWRFSVL